MIKFKLAILYLQFDAGKYPGSFSKLQEYLTAISCCRKTYFIIDNKDEGTKYLKSDDDNYFLQGDNSDWEFSGWQKGIDFIRKNKLHFHVILFVNDAFEAPGPSFLRDYATLATLIKSYFYNAMIGRIDSHGQETKVLGYDTKTWVCTNCFFVPFSVLKKMRNIISVNDQKLNEFLREEFSEGDPVFIDGAPINDAFKSHIVNWLTSNWHSKFTLDSLHWNFFRKKTKAILNEALLTARLREIGIKINSYGKIKYY